MTSMTTVQSVWSVCVSHVTLWYCHADTSVLYCQYWQDLLYWVTVLTAWQWWRRWQWFRVCDLYVWVTWHSDTAMPTPLYCTVSTDRTCCTEWLCVCDSVTMTTSMTTGQSVWSVCVSHATLWYCHADTSACATAVLTTFAIRPATVPSVAPSSTRCCRSAPWDRNDPPRPALLLLPLLVVVVVVLVCLQPRPPADLR